MKKLTYILFIAFLFAGLAGCGNNSTGPKHNGQPPQVPNFKEQAVPNLSYFKNNNPEGSTGSVAGTSVYLPKPGTNSPSDYSHYYAARELSLVVTTAALPLVKSYLGFLPTTGETANFKNGAWVWSYSNTYQETNFSVTFTAKELTSSVNWNLSYSYTDSLGNKIDDYKLIGGTTSNGGLSGNWTFNVLSIGNATESPFVKVNWENSGDTKQNITYKAYKSGILIATINYIRNSAKYTMTIELVGNPAAQTLFWNTDTKAGYYIGAQGNKECWGSDFKNTPCSS